MPPITRYVEGRPIDQWKILSAQLLSEVDWTSDDFSQAQEAVRWSTTQRTDIAVEISMQLYRRMMEELQTEKVERIVYDSILLGHYPQATHLLNAVVDSWRICRDSAESRRTKTPDQMITWIQALTTLEHKPIIACRTFSSIMQATVVQGENPTEPPLFCEQVLNAMFVQAQNTPDEARSWVLPDTIAITTALRAWARSSRPDAPERAEQLWLEWIQLSDDQIVHSLPNTVTYNTVMQALLSRPLDAYPPNEHRLQLLKVQDILAEMMSSPYPDVKPNTVTFRILIHGWLECKHADAADRACTVLHDMIQLYEAGQEDVQLDASIFSKVMARLIHVDRLYAQAESIFLKLLDLRERFQDPLLQPNFFVTRGMVMVYAKTGRPREAQVLLDDLEMEVTETGDTTRLPKRSHYSDVARAWCEVGDISGSFGILRRLMAHAARGLQHLSPDRQLIDDIFKAWAASPLTKDPEEGEALLRSLIEFAEAASNSKAMYPSATTFLRVITMLSQTDHTEAAHRAEALLWDLKPPGTSIKGPNLYPTRFHYSAVLAAWSRHRTRSAPHCRRIFDDAVKTASAGHRRAQPDAALYGAMLKIYSQNGDGEGAEELLSLMMDDFRNGNSSAEPTTSVLNIVLLAWLRSADVNRAKRSFAIFQRMIESSGTRHGADLAPNTRTYDLLRQTFSSVGLDFKECLRRLSSEVSHRR